MSFMDQAIDVLQNSLSLIFRTPGFVQIICVVIFLGYVSIDYEDVIFTVKPSLDLSDWCNYLTFWIVEENIIEVIIHIVIIMIHANKIHPLWGGVEIFKYFLITNILTALVSAGFYILLFHLTSNIAWIFYPNISGVSGYVSAVAVSLKQAFPEETFIRIKSVKFKYGHLPTAFLILSLVLVALDIKEMTYPIMVWSGFLLGWFYLKLSQSKTTKIGQTKRCKYDKSYPNLINNKFKKGHNDNNFNSSKIKSGKYK